GLEDVYPIQSSDGSNIRRQPGGAPREVELITKSGAMISVEERAAPLRDDRGNLSGMIVLFRRSQSMAVTASESKAGTSSGGGSAPLVDIVESISDPLMALDGQWRF